MSQVRNCANCGAATADRCANCSGKDGWPNWTGKKTTACGCGPSQSLEEDRIDVIGSNGNTGEHYGVEAGPLGGGDIYAPDEQSALSPVLMAKIADAAEHDDGKWGPVAAVCAARQTELTAPGLLTKAANIMEERGRQYDSPGGERSMGRAVAAFNAITGRNLTEPEGWLLLQVLKDVRQWQKPGYHADSAEDCIAYAALKAEALARG